METKQITLRLPEDIAERLRTKAQNENISVNAFILILIAKELGFMR